MPRRDIIVIGASAGGVEAVAQVVAGLPADLPAAVFVVVHVSPHHRSRLPEILSRYGPLPTAHAWHGDPIVPGRIYLAPPDRHLVLAPGRMELNRAPRENRTRPAVDPLFRTAARAYGPRVAAVILSGTQGDGTAGMMAVKAYGGVTIAQDPEEALYGGMVRRAIEYVELDHIAPVREIGALLASLSRSDGANEGGAVMEPMDQATPAAIDRDFRQQIDGERDGQTAVLACPECGGVLWQLEQGRLLQFHCHVGHVYSPEVLLAEKSESLEEALWSAVRTLVEKSTLTRQLAERLRRDGFGARAADVEEQAELDRKHAEILRELIVSLPSPTSQAYEVEEILDGAGRERERDPEE